MRALLRCENSHTTLNDFDRLTDYRRKCLFMIRPDLYRQPKSTRRFPVILSGSYCVAVEDRGLQSFGFTAALSRLRLVASSASYTNRRLSYMACSMANCFSNAEIIQLCEEATPDLLFGDPLSDNKILKLNNELAVKFGFLLCESEARNQIRAHELLNPDIVRVPKVYRYFTDSKRYGYIVMDFMEGKIKASVTESSQKRDMSRMLEHFASIKSLKPGSLTGGPSSGLLFGESDCPRFESINDMEAWFNDRLLDPSVTISFTGLDLVFCHLDLFPRNILWLDNHPPCVLDWGSAGFYPRLFERCSQLITQRSEENKVILDEVFSRFELTQIDLVRKARWNNVRFCL